MTVCPPANAVNPFAVYRPPAGKAWKWKWSDFKLCKVYDNCPIADEGYDNPGTETPEHALAPHQRYHKRVAACHKAYDGHVEYCYAMIPFRNEVDGDPNNDSAQCMKDALQNRFVCVKTAQDLFAEETGTNR